jgi:hypothetical protein
VQNPGRREKFSRAGRIGLRTGNVKRYRKVSGLLHAGSDTAESRSDLNQKLRRLVQQLGEAIHETVSESEQIAGVVADIKRQGFEVLLMLEATIGLNETEQQPTGSEVTSNPESEQDEKGSFTMHDVNFLKSLRISVAADGDKD